MTHRHLRTTWISPVIFPRGFCVFSDTYDERLREIGTGSRYLSLSLVTNILNIFNRYTKVQGVLKRLRRKRLIFNTWRSITPSQVLHTSNFQNLKNSPFFIIKTELKPAIITSIITWVFLHSLKETMLNIKSSVIFIDMAQRMHELELLSSPKWFSIFISEPPKSCAALVLSPQSFRMRQFSPLNQSVEQANYFDT